MTDWFDETSQWKKDEGLGSTKIVPLTGHSNRPPFIILKVDAHRRGISLFGSRMIFLVLLLVPMLLIAREASQVDDYYNSGFQRQRRNPPPQQREEEPTATRPTNPRATTPPVVIQEEAEEGNSEVTGRSPLAPSRVTRPVLRPSNLPRDTEDNPFQIEPADPGIRFEGEPNIRSFINGRTLTSAQINTPAYKPFIELFKLCAPPSCSGALINILRPGDPRCHGSGRAIDVTRLVCNGRNRNTYSKVFTQFYNCVKTKRIAVGPSKGAPWKTMFRETGRNRKSCHGISASSAKGRSDDLERHCHWNNFHITMTCNNGRTL